MGMFAFAETLKIHNDNVTPLTLGHS